MLLASGGVDRRGLGKNDTMVGLSGTDSASSDKCFNLYVPRSVTRQRFSDCGSEGWGFESLQAHNLRNMFNHNTFRLLVEDENTHPTRSKITEGPCSMSGIFLGLRRDPLRRNVSLEKRGHWQIVAP
jgi:hypothetical protein